MTKARSATAKFLGQAVMSMVFLCVRWLLWRGNMIDGSPSLVIISSRKRGGSHESFSLFTDGRNDRLLQSSIGRRHRSFDLDLQEISKRRQGNDRDHPDLARRILQRPGRSTNHRDR